MKVNFSYFKLCNKAELGCLHMHPLNHFFLSFVIYFGLNSLFEGFIFIGLVGFIFVLGLY